MLPVIAVIFSVIYRVIQEEKSIFWEVIWGEKACMNMCLILNGYRGRTIKSHSLEFCLWGWMKNKVNKRKVGKRDEFVACILDAAARMKKLEV